MSPWPQLLRLPDDCTSNESFASWFRQIAEVLLRSCNLVINGVPHCLTEVEFYYYSPSHPDPFAHRYSLQHQCGRWYLHRTGEGLRNGNYKGLDVTFGNEQAFGGILFRGLETPDDLLIDGPSLLVDYVMRQTGIESVAELNRQLLPKLAWQTDSPIHLKWTKRTIPLRIWNSSRIGMSPRRRDDPETRLRYFFRRYRFLTEPRRIRKGKLSLCLNLLNDGLGIDEIKELTSCPTRTLQKYIANFEIGKRQGDPSRFLGRELTPKEICELYGSWQQSDLNEQTPQ